MENIKQSICNFLAPFFQNYSLKDDENIFTLGMVNSLFAMQLVLFVEREFHIAIENEDLDLENFKSIRAMADLVMRKQSLSGSEAS
jgi:methoxymalonate biosynthesis acyl carrier protein